MKIFRLLFVFLGVFLSSTSAYSASIKKGIEVRVCQDRDCLTDGAVDAMEIVETLVKRGSSQSPVSITSCGCLGPCGKGPNVKIVMDGINLKDSTSNYNCFRKIDSPEAAASMLQQAGITVPGTAVVASKFSPVESTRKWYDFDRTTRIALQRLLYAVVGLPMIEADKTGTWDMINGEVYLNSYAIIAGLVFVGSQFMGTSSKANAVVVAEETK
jgi:(2Fe-2S) ferredoxin